MPPANITTFSHKKPIHLKKNPIRRPTPKLTSISSKEPLVNYRLVFAAELRVCDPMLLGIDVTVGRRSAAMPATLHMDTILISHKPD